MHWPRARLWTPLVLVALIAVGLTAYGLARRTHRFHALSEMHRREAAFWTRVETRLIKRNKRSETYDAVEAFSKDLAVFVLSEESRRARNPGRYAEYHRGLRIKYERASRRPWEAVSPDPLRPYD